ncbi:MAG: hypothetical protein AAF587_44300 [Bacteroidota bacterium]
MPRSFGPGAGVELLGSVLGAEDFALRYVTSKKNRLISLLQRLPSLGDPQVAYCLLRLCLGPGRLIHFMRCTPPLLYPAVGPILQSIDAEIRLTFESCSSLSIPDMAWRQACLPIRLGGLGLPCSAELHPLAYFASLFAARHDLPLLTSLPFDTTHAIWTTAAGQLDSLLPPAADRSFDEWFARGPEGETVGSQRSLSTVMGQARFESLLEDFAGQHAWRDCGRLRSLSLPHSGAFLTSLPNRNLGGNLSGPEFSVCIAWRLGLPMIRADLPCRHCGSSLDAFGDHVVSCARSGLRIHRHNAIRDCLFHIARSSGLSPSMEVSVDASSSRPADIYIPSWHGGHSCAVDVTVTHPLRSDLLSQARHHSGVGLRKGELRKQANADRCRTAGVGFLVFGLESFGGASESSRDLVRSFGDFQAFRDPTPRGILVDRFWQRISIILHRQQAYGFLDASALEFDHSMGHDDMVL